MFSLVILCGNCRATFDVVDGFCQADPPFLVCCHCGEEYRYGRIPHTSQVGWHRVFHSKLYSIFPHAFTDAEREMAARVRDLRSREGTFSGGGE